MKISICMSCRVFIFDSHGSIFQVGLRVALLGMNEDGEFRGVAEKEYGRVVEYPIPIALLGVEFQ